MDDPEISRAAKRMGSKGGKAKVPKGFAKMDPDKRAAALAKSLETRRANAAAKKKSGGKKD